MNFSILFTLAVMVIFAGWIFYKARQQSRDEEIMAEYLTVNPEYFSRLLNQSRNGLAEIQKLFNQKSSEYAKLLEISDEATRESLGCKYKETLPAARHLGIKAPSRLWVHSDLTFRYYQ